MNALLLVAPMLALAVATAGAAPSPPAGARPARSAAKAPARPRPVLPFVHDDWDRALGLAKARSLPMFVESWAPW
jgi:hypothetical protein